MNLTPVRKPFLKLGLFRPLKTLGKRGRGDSSTKHTPKTEQIPQEAKSRRRPARVSASQKPACLALQNEDSTEDVVIITTLDSIPFCCHEDLLTMSREQLISVALTLNEKLPAALKIDVSSHSPDALIRNSIELVVGLRGEVPPAPKAVRLHSDSGLRKMDINKSPPTSPLATRTRSRDLCMSLGSLRLAKLDEEDEDAMLIDRPSKRRKVSTNVLDVTPPKLPPPETISNIFSTPTPLHRNRMFRAQSQRVAPSGFPNPKKVSRSYSQHEQLSAEGMERHLQSTYAVITHPRYRRKERRLTTVTSSQLPKCVTPGNIDGAFVNNNEEGFTSKNLATMGSVPV